MLRECFNNRERGRLARSARRPADRNLGEQPWAEGLPFGRADTSSPSGESPDGTGGSPVPPKRFLKQSLSLPDVHSDAQCLTRTCVAYSTPHRVTVPADVQYHKGFVLLNVLTAPG